MSRAATDVAAEATLPQADERLTIESVIAGLVKLGLVTRLRSALSGAPADASDRSLEALRGLLPQRAVTSREAVVIAERLAKRTRALLESLGPVLDEADLAGLPWITAIERAEGLPKAGMASCLPNGNWVISVNGYEPLVRQRFSIAHELCHTIVDEVGETLVPTTRFAEHHERLERFCDQFAGALLMPKILLRADWADGLQAVARLAQRYRVSRAAMTVRLSQLGLLEPIARCAGRSTTGGVS